MRKLFIISALLTIIFATSCTKEIAEEIAPMVTSASMTATINDTTWTSLTRVTKHYSNTHLFLITGTDANGKVIAITIRGDQKGTYTSSTSIDSLNAQVGAVWKPNSNEYLSNSGTVTITDINTTDLKISGTFSFNIVNSANLSDAIEVKNGKFTNLTYSTEADSTQSK